MANNFPLNRQGYDAAITWLKSSGRKVESSVRHELSTDGFTIINLVNYLRSKNAKA